MADTSQAPAAERILDIAERLAQTQGFNGFSYADVAQELSVTKASLHYHFRSKADLGRALIVRYQRVFSQALSEIAQQSRGAPEKLRRYVALYDAVMREDRMCLCGMLAAEYSTLPEPMQEELRRFFDANEAWLSTVLDEGRRTGEFSFPERSEERARVFVGALEGAMLMARSYRDAKRFRSAAQYLMADLDAPAARARSRVARKVLPRRTARR